MQRRDFVNFLISTLNIYKSKPVTYRAVSSISTVNRSSLEILTSPTQNNIQFIAQRKPMEKMPKFHGIVKASSGSLAPRTKLSYLHTKKIWSIFNISTSMSEPLQLLISGLKCSKKESSILRRSNKNFKIILLLGSSVIQSKVGISSIMGNSLNWIFMRLSKSKSSNFHVKPHYNYLNF